MVAGTADQAEELAALGNVDPALTIALGQCLREGGSANWRSMLLSLRSLLSGVRPSPPNPFPCRTPSPMTGATTPVRG